ncbi:MAG: hypothetical protein IKT08_02345 [Bacteroidales bacterium]|nr:hypothetical protein [Bacteroidales bacterium]
MNNREAWERYEPSSYCESILDRKGDYSEAVYYLLKKRLARALRRVYDNHGFGLVDEFEDTIDDFYLYLYEGNRTVSQQPFSILERIRNRQAFFGWVLSTYRNYLLNRAKEMEREKDVLFNAMIHAREDEKALTEEAMTHILSTAIAYADQQFIVRNRFIFYRMLLSLLDHRMAIPQEEMAKALGMQAVTYRVCAKRQKDRFLVYVTLLEAGETLELNPWHRAMRNRILLHFDSLYEVLMEYYLQALEALPSSLEIQRLRMEFGSMTTPMVHEETSSYGELALTANGLYLRIRSIGQTLASCG